MFRITALNESTSSEDSEDQQNGREATKEAKEAQAFSLYNKALGLLQHGNNEQAEIVFRDLIDHDFLVEAWDLLDERGSEAIHPGLQLLYSIHKNLAAMAFKQKDYKRAMESYLEAVKIDNSEVNVWYKVGLTALELSDFQLAMLAFEQGLVCNPRHWPCLDKIITILYALNNYIECLFYIARAFELEVSYNKGYAFRNKIFSEQPSLKHDTEEFFQTCDPEVHRVRIDPIEAKEYIEEALKMRERNQIVCKAPDPPRLKFPNVVDAYSWRSIGKVLIQLYDTAVNSDTTISLGLKVDVPDTVESMCIETITAMETDDITGLPASGEMAQAGDADITKKPETDATSDQNSSTSKVEENMIVDGTIPVLDVLNKDHLESDIGESDSQIMDKNTMEVKLPVSGDPNKEINTQHKANIISDEFVNENSNMKSDNRDCAEIANVNFDNRESRIEALLNRNALVPYADNENGSGSLGIMTNPVNKVDAVSDSMSETKEHNVIKNEIELPEPGSCQLMDDKLKCVLNVNVEQDLAVSVQSKPLQVVQSSPAESSSVKTKMEEDSHDDIEVQQAVQATHELLNSLSVLKLEPKESNPYSNYVSPEKFMDIAGNRDSVKASRDLPKDDVTLVKCSITVCGLPLSRKFNTDVHVLPDSHSLSEGALELQEDKHSTEISSSISATVSIAQVTSNTVTSNIAGIDQLLKSITYATESISSPIMIDSPSSNSLITANPTAFAEASSLNMSTTSAALSKASSLNMSSTSLDLLDGIPNEVSTTQCVSKMLTAGPNLTSSESNPVIHDLLCLGHTPVNIVSPSSAHLSESSAIIQTPSLIAPLKSFYNVTHTTANSASVNVMANAAASSPQLYSSRLSRSDHGYSRLYNETSVVVHALEQSVDESDFLKVGSQYQVPLGNITGSPKKGQKRKRISLATEEIMLYGKRRSARVTGRTSKKKEETVNFHELLQAFIPPSLKNEPDTHTYKDMLADKYMEDVDENKRDGTSRSMALVTKETKLWNETVAVKEYIEKMVTNHGLVFMLTKYLHEIAIHWNSKWSDGVADIYLQVYSRARKHWCLPNVFDTCHKSIVVQEMAQICLVWLELQLDKWLVQRCQGSDTIVMSPKSPHYQLVSMDEVPPSFDDDVWFLTLLCGHADCLGDIWIIHCIRVFWMKARYNVVKGNMEEAVLYYQKTREYLEFGKEELAVDKVYIPNCHVDCYVDINVVRSQQELLQTTRSLEETQKLYENREYAKVVEILLHTITSEHDSKILKLVSDSAERRSLLIMLQESLYNMGDYQKCLSYGEESFHECYQRFRNVTKSEEKAEWVKTMVQTFANMQRVLYRDVSMIKKLPMTKMLRLLQNLITLIDMNMSLPDSNTEMAVDSVLPWILLYYIISQEESKNESLSLNDKGGSSETIDETTSSSSHMLLNIAHEYLGSRGWCTKSDGALLLFSMEVLVNKIENNHSKLLEEYQQAFEQCVYCLYGHPNKKGKAKHLQDHNAAMIKLEWKHAICVFEYFKPKTLPEFDGYRSYTISPEMESLLKSITPLIPKSSKSMGVPLEDIQSYIEGTLNTAPVIQDDKQVTLPVVGEIYYLLADYYLKNKEFMKAIKFYMQDLCMNPVRLDSWAGMALSRMSQLESKLTSAELKMGAPIYKKSVAALRCFKRAVKIDSSNNKLWIEYGTLAYQLHSHASRQIKWKKRFEMDDDTVKIATESKREMLQVATKCFHMAAEVELERNEDEWLHNYMQGKCAEKARKPAQEYLTCYFKALSCLHKENAKYPKVITCTYTTPHFAVEALEMYYRVHVSILKLLLQHPSDNEAHDYRTYVKYIIEAANTPFYKRMEKGQKTRTDRDSASSTEESSSSEIMMPVKSKKGPAADHTYFRQKSSTSLESKNEENPFKPLTTVTTLELHSESQTSQDPVTLTTTECPKLPSVFTTENDGTLMKQEHIMEKVDKENVSQQRQLARSSFSISSILGETEPLDKTEKVVNVCGGSAILKAGDGVYIDTEDTENEIRRLLNDIEDRIEAGVGTVAEASEPLNKSIENSQEVEIESEINSSSVAEVADNINTPVTETDNNKEYQGTQQDDQINHLLQMPRDELHKLLVERCRLALITCLQRFPTHYKAHYRLAYLYVHSPYHKNLSMACNLLMGTSNIQQQQLEHMPIQGLFGERKHNKFFQGIWRIPIDEIDRAGSFPSHLNRCIELALKVLREQKDSLTLHQVHLQLNRNQQDIAKKYIRDDEKKYYALKSHRYTLDAVEMQTEDMKLVADADTRQQFLMTVYNIYEHGVHKLNKLGDKTSKLLAEAYRLAQRKIETLPPKMLLDEAVRFCKHLIAQKSKPIIKLPDGKLSSTLSPNRPSATSTPVQKTGTSTPVQGPKLISLTNSMKSQVTNYNLLKGCQTSVEGTQQIVAETTNNIAASEGNHTNEEVIVLSDSSVDSPHKVTTHTKLSDKGRKVQTVVTTAPTVKIKMGLLQALKRLRPSLTESPSEMETSQEDTPSSVVVSEMESEGSVHATSDSEDSSSDSSSTSSSTSSSSSGDSSSSSSSEESDNEEDNDTNSTSDGKSDNDDNCDSMDGSGTDDKRLCTNTKSELKITNKSVVKRKINVSQLPEDEESSDNANEIDLLTSDDSNDDDDNDKDYKASEDEVDEEDDDDIIMISDDECIKSIMPSAVHPNVNSGTEVLVKELPDFDPIISSVMLSEANQITKF